MYKNAKKSSIAIFVVSAIALLTIVAFAYGKANTDSNENHDSENGMMNGIGHMMDSKGMDEMHKQMTENLDLETKEKMDKVHEMCKKSMEENGDMGEMMQDMMG